MRLIIPDLLPETDYGIQVRADDGTGESEWSPIFEFTTMDDDIEPLPPGNVTWEVTGDGSTFVGEWDEVTHNTLGNEIVVKRYEVELTSGAVTKIVPVLPRVGRHTYNFSSASNISLFGTLKDTVAMRVRVVGIMGKQSNWSPTVPISKTIGGPGPITNLVATPVTNGISLTWNPPTSGNHIGYYVYVGTTSGFTPSTANRVFTGAATQFTYSTTTYVEHWFKVTAYDRFSRESAPVSVSSTPQNPFLVDVTPPGTPSSFAATITTSADGKSATADLTWAAPADDDLAGYIIRYRKGTDPWYTSPGIAQTATSTKIDLESVYTGYEFQIAAVDANANYSAWVATSPAVTQPVANTPPPNVTGTPTITFGRESAVVDWAAVSATDLSHYRVEIAENSGFTTGLLTFNTEAKPLSVAGLKTNQAYHVRVKAVDTGGLLSTSWSSTGTGSTGKLSDGAAPTSSPAPTVTGGLGYLYATWTAVSNADPVTYEVHMSTTSGFTPNAGTKVSEVMGTFAMIDTLPQSTTGLTYGTTYYVKLIAKDADGAAAAGAQGSSAPVKGAIGDITITPGDIGAVTTLEVTTALNGKNKITHSSSAPVNGVDGNIAGDTWLVYNGSNQITAQYRGVGSSTWVSETIENAFIANLDAGKISANSTFTNDLNVKSTFTLGDASTAGVIKSYTYNSTNKTGFSLSSAGLEIWQGKVSANVLETNTTITANLGVTGTMTISSGGYIQSSDYNGSTLGWRLGPTGLEILNANSTVKAEAIESGTLGGSSGSGTINIAAGSNLVFNGGYMRSNTYAFTSYNAGATSGWYLGNDGLVIAQGAVRAEAFAGGTMSAATIELTSTGKIQTVGYNGTSGFRLSSSGLEVPAGWLSTAGLTVGQTFANSVLTNASSTTVNNAVTQISGDKITTGTIQSGVDTANNPLPGNGTPMWSIPRNGSASFANLLIRGNTTTGSSSSDMVSSGNYVTGGTAGWRLVGNGDAFFNQNLQAKKITMGSDTSRIEILNGAWNTGGSYSMVKLFTPNTGSSAAEFYAYDMSSSITRTFLEGAAKSGSSVASIEMNSYSTYADLRLNATGEIILGAATITGGRNIGLGGGNLNGIGGLSGHNGATITIETNTNMQGTQNHFPNIEQTTNAANARLNPASSPANRLLLSTSLSKFKLEQEDITLEDARQLLEVTPRTWYDSVEVRENGGTQGLRRVPGLIAEDVEEHAPLFATYSNEGLQGVAYDRVPAALLVIIKDQQAQIKSLEDRVSALENAAAGTPLDMVKEIKGLATRLEAMERGRK